MKAANTMEVRQQNASYILHDIECNPGITNAEIAQGRGLSVPTISNIVNILKNGDMIMTAGTGESSGGRRPFQLSLNAGYQSYVGVSIAKHTVYLVLIDFAGQILDKQRHYVDFAGTEEYWQQIAGLVSGLQEQAQGPCQVGIALPGFVDRSRNMALGTYTLGVAEVALDYICELLDLRVVTGDSCRLAGLAQMFGKRDFADSFFILLSRRISGILIQGKEFFHMDRSSLDIGSMILDPNGTTSAYGIPGSFLELCSASRIMDMAKECSKADTVEDFFAELAKGDQALETIWHAFLKNLSVALHNISAIFGVGIVVGGEMAKYIEPFAMELDEYLRRLTPDHEWKVELHFSGYGEYDDAYGAALEARGFQIGEQLPVILKNAAASQVQAKPKTRRRN